MGTGSNQLDMFVPGTECYINDAERWHITIFHTSKFDDTRPNPSQTAANSLDHAPAARPLPSPAALQQEQDAMQETVAMSQALNLEVGFCSGCKPVNGPVRTRSLQWWVAWIYRNQELCRCGMG